MSVRGIGVVAAIVVVVGGVTLVSLRNGLIERDEAARGAWAQVESAYQRRFDLTGPLVEVVQAAAAHEQGTLTAIVEARTRVIDTQRAAEAALGTEAEGETARLLTAASEAMRSFLTVTVEAYPQITATEAFVTLQKQLEGSENRIHVARLRFNDDVRDLNAMVRKWGALPLCGSVAARQLFAADAGSDAPVALDLGGSAGR